MRQDTDIEALEENYDFLCERLLKAHKLLEAVLESLDSYDTIPHALEDQIKAYLAEVHNAPE